MEVQIKALPLRSRT